MTDTKFPDVTVQLTGEDGNAIFIIGRVRNALRAAGVDKSEIDAFQKEAMSGDYHDLLATVRRTVRVQ